MINEVKDRNDLADLLGITRSRLTYILYIKHVDNMYTSFEITKKDGGVRRIDTPNNELKFIQRRLLSALLEYQREVWGSENDAVCFSHAFEEGKSIFTNARIHRNKRFVYTIDLENFFDSFHFGRVKGYFQKDDRFLLPEKVAIVIAQLTCFNGRLPQGAPTSPIITNYICNIFDRRIVKLIKKYHLNYTRYADNLTFSTNDKRFIENVDAFYHELKDEVERAGFKINENKTRLSFRDSRQEVTGVVVNKKYSIKREYYKQTRAMAHALYTNGEFLINGQAGTINQLEGRFSFINQADYINNRERFSLDMSGKPEKHYIENLNGREKEYRQFLFYKYFFSNPRPLIITEGKTDILYLKAALKNLYKEYPTLIKRKEDGHFEFQIAFLRKSKRLKYFLNLTQDGADAFGNIYQYYAEADNKNYPQYIQKFKELRKRNPTNAVILLFDNEIGVKDKPVEKFINGKFKNGKKFDDKEKDLLSSEWKLSLSDNLYMMVTPLAEGKVSGDIEDLFDQSTLNTIIDGKKFCKKSDFDTDRYYGKEIFSKYIMSHYANIDFERFKELLDVIKDISEDYKKQGE